ncbi:unnamed protein product [Trichobilharzia regenti]|nr:unnamed protein product [Trichobilharzia regenti]
MFCLFRERIRQHYQALLHRLDEVGRNEILIRRSQLSSGTVGGNSLPGGPSNEAVISRRLEKVFEVFHTAMFLFFLCFR